MHVHISTLPIRSESKVRGVGIYTRELFQALQKRYPTDQFTLSSTPQGGVELLHYPYFEPFFLTLPRRRTIPLVVTIHDLIPLKYPAHFPRGLRGSLKWQLQKYLVRRSNHIITDSHSSAADIKHLLHLPASQISVIPLAPSHVRTTSQIKKAVAETYHLPARYALYVGDVNWNKNLLGLIEAFSSFANSSLHLVLVGQAFVAEPPSPELLAIKSAIKSSPAQKKIHLIGYVPSHHLPAIYSLATLYVQPSWDEGFGLTILEAMAAGCPVLSSNRGSLPEVGGAAALYFDPDKSGDLAAKISELSRSPALRDNLVQQGRDQLKHFSWDQTAQLTHEVYEKVLAHH